MSDEQQREAREARLVRFWIYRYTGHIEELDGDDVSRRLPTDPELAAWLCDQEAPEGGLVIGEATFEDDLSSAVQRLCFGAIAELAPGARWEYRFFTSATCAYLTMSADGETIAIDGEFVPSVSYPTRELLPALYACGERYLALLAQLRDSGRSFSDVDLAQLQPFAAEAREALAARNYG